MGFMDKVKSGVTEAGNKAKVLVEVNKLKLQNSGKQKDIEKQWLEIGKRTFLAKAGRRPPVTEVELQPLFNDVYRLEDEIQENAKQIMKLSNEKECECGKASPLDARFCPSCGRTFGE
mgnify:CR=1 FL=1|jgi:hypothetical protein